MQNNVRALRVAAHLSQVELASLAGITRQTLSLIEKGAYNPSLKLCLNICYRLGQTLDQVFWVAPGDQ